MCYKSVFDCIIRANKVVEDTWTLFVNSLLPDSVSGDRLWNMRRRRSVFKSMMEVQSVKGIEK